MFGDIKKLNGDAQAAREASAGAGFADGSLPKTTPQHVAASMSEFRRLSAQGHPNLLPPPNEQRRLEIERAKNELVEAALVFQSLEDVPASMELAVRARKIMLAKARVYRHLLMAG